MHPNMTAIKEVHASCPADFEKAWVYPSLPVVVRGFGRDWAALSKWTAHYFSREFGETRVPVAGYTHGRVNFLDGVGVDYSERSLSEIFKAAQQPGQSLAVGAPLERFPARLSEDLRKPAVYDQALWGRSKVFLSPVNVGAPLHRDIPHNIHVQIKGRKQSILFSPADNRNVYPFPLFSRLPAFAYVDAEAPDFERFPLFRAAHPFECILEPGDALLLPSLWWHQTRALGFSLSVRFWFASGPLAALAWASDTAKRILGISR